MEAMDRDFTEFDCFALTCTVQFNKRVWEKRVLSDKDTAKTNPETEKLIIFNVHGIIGIFEALGLMSVCLFWGIDKVSLKWGFSRILFVHCTKASFPFWGTHQNAARKGFGFKLGFGQNVRHDAAGNLTIN